MIINRNNYETMVIDYLEGNLLNDDHAAFELFLINNPDIQEEVSGLMEATFPLDDISLGDKSFLKKNSVLEFEKIDMLLAKKLEGGLTDEEDQFLNPLLENDEEVKKSWQLFQLTRFESNTEETNSFDFLKFPATIDYSTTENLLIGKMEGDLTQKQEKALSKRIKNNNDLALDAKFIGLTKLQSEGIVYSDKALLRKAVVIPLWKKIAPVLAIAAMLLLGVFFFNDTGSVEIANTLQEVGSNSVERKVVNSVNENFIDRTPEDTNEEVVNPVFVSPKDDNFANNQTPSNDGENSNKGVKVNPFKKELINHKPLDMVAAEIIETQVFKGTVLDDNTEEIVPDIIPEQNLAYENPDGGSYLAAKEYDSLLDYAASKTKEKLWGDTEYPDENYTVALLNKKAEKSEILGTPVISKNDSGWGFSIGRFSYKKTKS